MYHFARMAEVFPFKHSLNAQYPNLYIEFSESTSCLLIGRAVYPIIGSDYRDIDTTLCIGIPEYDVVSPYKREYVSQMAAKLIDIAIKSEVSDVKGTTTEILDGLTKAIKHFKPDLYVSSSFVERKSDCVFITLESPNDVGNDAGHQVAVSLPPEKLRSFDVIDALKEFLHNI